MKTSLNVFCIFCLFLACSESKKEPVFERYDAVPDTGQGKVHLLQKPKKAELLNLTPIFNGVDSFELRLWIHDPTLAGNDLFIIKYDTFWQAFHYFLDGVVVVPSKTVKAFSDSTFLVKSIYPIYGWDGFVDSISQFRLDTLPTQHLIPGFAFAAILDGYSYEVEIATTKYYRRLRYSHPDNYPQKQSQIFAHFIEMFKRHLGNDPEWMGHYE